MVEYKFFEGYATMATDIESTCSCAYFEMFEIGSGSDQIVEIAPIDSGITFRVINVELFGSPVEAISTDNERAQSWKIALVLKEAIEGIPRTELRYDAEVFKICEILEYISHCF